MVNIKEIFAVAVSIKSEQVAQMWNELTNCF